MRDAEASKRRKRRFLFALHACSVRDRLFQSRDAMIVVLSMHSEGRIPMFTATTLGGAVAPGGRRAMDQVSISCTGAALLHSTCAPSSHEHILARPATEANLASGFSHGQGNHHGSSSGFKAHEGHDSCRSLYACGHRSRCRWLLPGWSSHCAHSCLGS